MGRIGPPREFAGLVGALVSPHLGFVTGAVTAAGGDPAGLVRRLKEWVA